MGIYKSWIPFLAIVIACAANAKGSDRLVYNSPEGISFEVTADGLSSIRHGDREIASGGWSIFNAEHWFKNGGSGVVKTNEMTEPSIGITDSSHAQVRQTKGDVICISDYSFDGSDVLISTRVENRHPTESMNIVGFSGLKFTFARPPEGQMPVQHISYFQAHGIGLCHPGHWAKIGGTYAADDSIGVGTSPWRTGMMRTLTLWDYGSWAGDRREADPQRKLLYFAVAPIPPRGTRTVDFRLRVSRNCQWQHLLSPYREHFQTTFGSIRYHADRRWIATDYLNKNQESISPENPYGFHGGSRRIDTAEGIDKFCETLIPALQKENGQGVIVWGHGGDDPRGGMYRPDFDILPPEVEENWTTLAKRFQDADLKLGVCTRPRHLAVRRNWKRDMIIDINPQDAGHRDMLWQRFQNMIDRGCTLFYLDSFGSSFEDVQLMQHLREKMGPKILTFAEHQCDAIVPFSGGYSETTFVGAKDGNPPSYRVWSGVSNWEIYQYLCPGAQLSARLYQIQGTIPDDFERVERFFYRHNITPLMPVSEFRRLPGIGAIQHEFRY